MNNRNEFAARAMAAMISTIVDDYAMERFRRIAGSKGLTVRDWIADEAYRQADAMNRRDAHQGDSYY